MKALRQTTNVNDQTITIDDKGDIYDGESNQILTVAGLDQLVAIYQAIHALHQMPQDEINKCPHHISLAEEEAPLLPEFEARGVWVGCQLISSADLLRVHAISISMRRQ